jgi:hypothetical protein
MAKFTQMAPAQTGTTDRSGSGKRRRPEGQASGQASQQASQQHLSAQAPKRFGRGGPFGGRFSWPRGPDEIIGRTCDRRVGGGAWSSYCFGFVAS